MVVFWAVDPTDQDLEIAQRVGKVASLWSSALETQATPVSVISHRNLTWLSGKVPVPLKEVLSDVAIRNIRSLVAKVNVKNIAEPRLIFREDVTRSRRSEARALVEEANRQKASAIVVAAHGPDRLKQIRLGSFTEYLIATSTVPIVVVNPKTEPPEKIERILFPTDFSEDSEIVFRHLLDIAKKVGAAVVVFHVNDLAFRSLTLAGDWGVSLDPLLVSEAWNEEQQRKNKKMAAWEKLAEDQGVRCKIVSISSGDGLSQTIIDVERNENADLVAMTTYAGPVEQAFLGSVARDVIYGAARPVLIVPVPRDRKLSA